MATKQAEVRCAGISFAVKKPFLDPDGEQVVNEAGVKQFTVERGFARMGEIVELSEHEFAIHAAQGGVQEPGESPLPGAPGSRPQATPFTVPAATMDGSPVPWTAPIMGDPAAAGAGLSDVQLANAAGALTPEQIAELSAKADGDDGELKEPTELDSEEASVDEIREFIRDNRLNVEDTIDLAFDDPEIAAKVLEAEEGDKDRLGVTVALEKIIKDAEETA